MNKQRLACALVLLVISASAIKSCFAGEETPALTPANRSAADRILRLAFTTVSRLPSPQENQQNLAEVQQAIAISSFRQLPSANKFVAAIHAANSYLLANTDDTGTLSKEQKDSDKNLVKIYGSAQGKATPTPAVGMVQVDLNGGWERVRERLQETQQFQSFDRRPKPGFKAEELTRKLDEAYQSYCSLVSEFQKRGFTLSFERELCAQQWDWRWESKSTTISFCFYPDGTFDAWMTPHWNLVYKCKGSWKLTGNLLTAKMEKASKYGLIYDSEMSYPFQVFDKRAVCYVGPDVIVLDGDKDNRLTVHRR